jgi:hypothetical protein
LSTFEIFFDEDINISFKSKDHFNSLDFKAETQSAQRLKGSYGECRAVFLLKYLGLIKLIEMACNSASQVIQHNENKKNEYHS